MKKVGVLLFILILSSFAVAQNDTNVTTEPSITQDTDKIEKAYICLESKVKGSCSSLTTEEIAFTILSSPDSAIITECKNALLNRKTSSGCWSSSSGESCSIKDTSLAVLALNPLGEDTSSAESWLLEQTETPKELEWYLQQDSESATQCILSAQGDENTININENKKISGSPGDCFSLARANFWLRVNENCYNIDFSITCRDKFIASLLYKNRNSDIYFVLSETQAKPATEKAFFEVISKCFGINNCNYEETVWATLALQKTNHKISEYIPYIVAMGDSNKKYLPNAFIFMLTNYADYGSRLIEEKGLGDYWQVDGSSHSKFYNTAMALSALKKSTAEQVADSKLGILFDQPANGCWNDDIQDTAMILWALTDHSPSLPGTGTTYCPDNHFCIPTAECPTNEQFPNYFCPGLGTTCCMNENLKSCTEYGGEECASDERCRGNSRRATDTEDCCIGECVAKTTGTGCEAMGFVCRTDCANNQELMNYTCDAGLVCCRTKTTPEEGLSIWIWILIILIILVLAAIGYIKRDKLRLFFFQIKSKFKKDKTPPSTPSQPPRPGFPPIRRAPQQRPPIRQLSGAPKPIDDVFKKLKEMTK